ncbi:hypothetical protein [Aeromonas sp. sif2416]|uniref:hypothetical protein n=1 Tax=Aeromonas sp. sif2416 TaxID=2854793 RepID=UPI001C437C41|nr:hypothetical protein [Aeromonas sp. sif2416]MBV7437615.1 hypothetical protein [Aeromonas sp. sif2416]
MLFSKDFVTYVLENPYRGLVQACDRINDSLSDSQHNIEWSSEEQEVLIEGAAFINLILMEKGFLSEVPFPEITNNINANCITLNQYIQSVRGQFSSYDLKNRVNNHTETYRSLFANAFSYEFSQGDLERVQLLINELRAQISNNEILDASHRQRLLKRLEHLQSELHKKVSDLDRFWGLVGDAGVVLGKLGTDAKPIVDRIKEIAEIAWKTQARTEELPSSATNPMLNETE